MNHHLTVARLISACAAVLAFAGEQRSTAPSPTTGSTNRIRVLIVDGFSNHDWRRTTACVRGILAAANLFDVAVSTIPAQASDPGYAQWCPRFGDYDVVIQTCNDLNGNGPPWPPGRACPLRPSSAMAAASSSCTRATTHSPTGTPTTTSSASGGGRRSSAPPCKSTKTARWRIPPGQGNGTGHAARTDRVVHRLGDHPIHAGMPAAWMTPLIEVYTFTRGPAENISVLSWPGPQSAWTVADGVGRELREGPGV